MSAAIANRERNTTQNAINWFEIPALDFDRAIKFYENILGVSLRREVFHGTSNALFPANEQGVGGAVVCAEGYIPSASGSFVYLNADGKLDAVLSRVEAAGGQIVRPKTAIPPQGYFAWLIDSEGNKIALHEAPTE